MSKQNILKKMKNIIQISFFLFLPFSCQEKKSNLKEDTTVIKNPITIEHKNNITLCSISHPTFNQENIINNYSESQPEELNIYPLNHYKIDDNNTIAFIPLTGVYEWDNHTNSHVIENKYLGDKAFNEYHQLSKTYRAKFLKLMAIKETDKVFIFNYSLDSILTYHVKDLSLMAHISVYGANHPVSEDDYLIGFNLKKQTKLNNWDYNSFVSIGANNPFTLGEIQAIVWEETDSQSFPIVNIDSITSSRLNKIDRPKQTFSFLFNDLKYSLQDYGYSARHIVIKRNNQIVLNEVFFDGESISLAPINYNGAKNEYSPQQFTGKIFKHKPPVIFGLFYVSFGCEWMNVLESKDIIPILCDNRH